MRNGSLNKLLAIAKKDREIVAVLLYGRHARGYAKPISDIDLCLVLRKEKGAFKKRVEYSTVSENLDVQVFQKLPLYIKVRVLREGKTLHCKDEDLLYKIAIDTVKDFEQFKKAFSTYLDTLVRG